MKKILCFISLLCLLSACAAPAAKAKTAVKAPAAKAAVKAPALSDPQSWTMVVVPDIQTYIKQIENHGILDMMLAWMVRRRAEMNIQQVLFTGDLVYRNDLGRVSKNNDLVSDEQWKALSRIMTRMDGELPYFFCSGNHDYGVSNAENRNSWFNKHFPTNRNTLTRRHLVECCPNAFGIRTLENAVYEFTAPHPDNRKFLVISLQFAPTDAILKWAAKVSGHPRFADHIGIVLTHSYMYANGSRIQKENSPLNAQGGNVGEAIFRKLVYPSKNIRLVVCGHVCRPDDWDYAVGFSTDKNQEGKTVSQLVFNTQAIGGGWHGSGGDGWLRLLEFMPDKKTVKCTTFSPYFYRSPSTRHLAWRTDKRNQFTFTLEK